MVVVIFFISPRFVAISEAINNLTAVKLIFVTGYGPTALNYLAVAAWWRRLVTLSDVAYEIINI